MVYSTHLTNCNTNNTHIRTIVEYEQQPETDREWCSVKEISILSTTDTLAGAYERAKWLKHGKTHAHTHTYRVKEREWERESIWCALVNVRVVSAERVICFVWWLDLSCFPPSASQSEYRWKSSSIVVCACFFSDSERILSVFCSHIYILHRIVNVYRMREEKWIKYTQYPEDEWKGFLRIEAFRSSENQQRLHRTAPNSKRIRITRTKEILWEEHKKEAKRKQIKKKKEKSEKYQSVCARKNKKKRKINKLTATNSNKK